MGKYSDMFFGHDELKAAMGGKTDGEKLDKAQEQGEDAQDLPVNGPTKAAFKGCFRCKMRRLASEKALADALDWHFEPETSYHIFTFGDIDTLSYVRHILKQQKIIYLAISTWVIAMEDVKEIEEWYRRGMVKRVDFYLDRGMPKTRPLIWDELQAFIAEEKGRAVTFFDHAKVICIKGEKFDALIESSANVNANNRSENTVITTSTELVDYYIGIFGSIRPFNRHDYGAEAYQVDETT